LKVGSRGARRDPTTSGRCWHIATARIAWLAWAGMTAAPTLLLSRASRACPAGRNFAQLLAPAERCALAAPTT